MISQQANKMQSNQLSFSIKTDSILVFFYNFIKSIGNMELSKSMKSAFDTSYEFGWMQFKEKSLKLKPLPTKFISNVFFHWIFPVLW